VHRFYVVDDKSRPVGVVSLTDVCKLFRDYVETSARVSVRARRDAFQATFRSFDGKALGAHGDKVGVATLARRAPSAISRRGCCV
jgi:hypothetical protein